MTEQFNDIGSLYILENQQWKKVGNGTLVLMTNIHNPTHIIVKVIDKNGNVSQANTGTVFQCKPKTKPKGNKSYILKGTDTKHNNEYILAARFKSEDTATCFRIAIENCVENITTSPSTSPIKKAPSCTLTIDSHNALEHIHNRYSTITPEQMRKQLKNKDWDCKLCTAHNRGELMICNVCFSPRLLHKKNASNEDSITLSIDSQSQSVTPKMGRLNIDGLDVNTAAISVIYGDTNAATTPYSNATFDWSSVDANTKLSEKPSPDGGDIDSTKKDFIRILTTIESNITHQDPLKLFDDLHKVAKRLGRKDPKYRTLDLKNPVVQERLMKVEGVDAYLKYLGFEEGEKKNKLICPDDQPPRSVIKTAQECCKAFLTEWKKKQHLFDLLSQSAKDLKSVKSFPKHAVEIKQEEELKEELEEEEEADAQYTLRQLVWSITHQSCTADEKTTADVLLLCHSVFAESSHLLACLVERFHGKTALQVNGDKNKNKDSQTLMDERWNIQIKVGSMLSSWMKTFWEQDFEQKIGLMEDIESFFESIETEFNQDKRVQLLLKKMRGIYDMQFDKYSSKYDIHERQTKIQHKDIGKLIGRPKNFNIIEEKAKTLAEQFTLMHFKAFKAITKRECLGQSWKKKDGSAQNILDMIKLFNSTAKWVQILILTQPTTSKRAKVMKLCIMVATFMKNFRNFSGSCAFHSALTSTPIHRLKIAWSKLSTNDIKKYKQLQKIFGFGNNWKLLRKLHREAHAPAILHTGLFLQDLVGIDEGHNNKLKNGKVNFKKLLKLHEKIDTIAMYQQEEYHFKENLLIQSVIEQDFKSQEHIDGDFLFKISCSVKASDAKKKK